MLLLIILFTKKASGFHPKIIFAYFSLYLREKKVKNKESKLVYSHQTFSNKLELNLPTNQTIV